MTTEFQTSAQQYNNRTIDHTVPVNLAPCRVWFVADVSAVGPGSPWAMFRAEFLTDGVVRHAVQSEVRGIGQAAIGSRLPEGVTHLRLFLDVSGRMTMAFRILTFGLSEDVPEGV